jgi:hypothetical protein
LLEVEEPRDVKKASTHEESEPLRCPLVRCPFEEYEEHREYEIKLQQYEDKLD